MSDAKRAAAEPGRAEVATLYRYPVKGLSGQATDRLEVTTRDGLEDDRRFALALGTTEFDPGHPEPLDKGYFLMLRRNEELAALATRYAAGTLSIAAPERPSVEAEIATAAGRTAIEDFFSDYVGEACRGRPRLVEAQGHKFTDVSVVSPEMMKAVSLINLASVRDLEARLGRPVHPLRFRANVYVEGLPAFAETNWLEREVAIGSARFRCVMATKRCAAIDVDPLTGARDMSLPKALMTFYGNPNLGVYLEVIGDGAVRLGDTIVV